MGITYEIEETSEKIIIRYSRLLSVYAVALLILIGVYYFTRSDLTIGIGLVIFAGVLAFDQRKIQKLIGRAQDSDALSVSGSRMSLRNPLTLSIDRTRLKE
jgi:FtsH-binding integral membrane protein